MKKHQPNPIKLQPYTAYMKEFNIQSKEDLKERLDNAKENNLRRLELREKMRAGTIMLKKNFQKQTEGNTGGDKIKHERAKSI